jgi:sec-independent protein translocase protein TatC
MLRRKTDEDLFRESTMTFGEHLEELRVCLFKAILGLVIGFIVGLTVGGDVAVLIQRPMTKALEDYYQKQSIKSLDDKLAELQASGMPLPYAPKQIEDLVYKDRLLPTESFVDPADVLRQLKHLYPGQFGTLPSPPAEPERQVRKGQMIPLFLWHPLEDDPRVKVKSFSAAEGFGIYMKAALLVGAVIASPWIFYQIWSFVAAGLYTHERRYVRIYLPLSVGLFLVGVIVAFAFVFEPVLRFLFTFNSWMGIDIDPRISEWLGFVLILPLGFGIGFQLPLVMLFLERIGIMTVQRYWSYWRVAILVIFVIAALLMPPDPYSMTLLALSLVLLYFGGILLCKLMPRYRRPAEEFDEFDV